MDSVRRSIIKGEDVMHTIDGKTVEETIQENQEMPAKLADTMGDSNDTGKPLSQEHFLQIENLQLKRANALTQADVCEKDLRNYILQIQKSYYPNAETVQVNLNQRVMREIKGDK